MKNELISVIIPVYNSENTIEKCINSVLNQTYQNLEVVAIDDGSSDNSVNIIKQLAMNDDRVICIEKRNGGVSSARNKGIDSCKGEWLFFLDSDDWIFPDGLEALLKRAVDNCSKVAVGSIVSSNEHSNQYENEGNCRIFSTNDDYKGGRGLGNMVTSRLYAKELLLNIRFPESLKILEDMVFNALVLAANRPFRYLYLNKSVYFYNNIDSNSLSHNYRSENLLAAAEWFVSNLDTVYRRDIFVDKAIKNIIQYRLETHRFAPNTLMYLRKLLFSRIPFSRKAGYIICYLFPRIYSIIINKRDV